MVTTTMDVDTVNHISLDALHDSTILHVNLYPSQAQITRVFKFNVGAGQNKLTVSNLTNVLDHDSLRVEGRGPAIIHDVTAWKVDMTEPEETSLVLDELRDKHEELDDAIARCKKAIKSIEEYMSKLEVEHLDISKLGEAMDVYDNTEAKWDKKLVTLEKELATVKKRETAEKIRLEEQVGNRKLRSKVALGLHAEAATEIEIFLIYVVSHCGWEAGYDIRVDMQDVREPVRVVYKAVIKQKTAELWGDVPVTLETARPTVGVEIPRLSSWHINLAEPPAGSSGRGLGGAGLGKGGAFRHRMILPDEDDLDFDMDYDCSTITSKGNVNATFRIPGKMTIPCDDEPHSVTITELMLEATMSWVCIPKGDTRVHLKATIKNSSEYTFLPGPSNVYVDRSFIAKSDVPSVSPQEVFECPLGLDPTIRVTYHPCTKLISESGFYNKYKKHSFSQRIGIHNTKSVAVDGLRIADHIPVSQNAHVIVKLINPALTLPGAYVGSFSGKAAPSPSVNIADGVVAQWNGTDAAEVDVEALGKDGKLDWICTVPALGKINLLLQWEVSTTQKGAITGL